MNLLKTIMLAAAFCANSAQAFDDHREGFILGFGAGFHNLSATASPNNAGITTQTYGGLATSFKIGAGITDQFLLYYVRNGSWYTAPYSNGFTTRNTLYASGLSGVGGSYFLSPTAPSAYFLAALGTGDLVAPAESMSAYTGSASMFGGGYEFSKSLMLEGTLLHNKLHSTGFNAANYSSTALQVTINYLFY